MPSELISQTQWHGNPRGEPSYAWTIYTGDVPSPYDGEFKPTYRNDVSDTPHETAGAVDLIEGNIKASRGIIQFTGVVKEGQAFSINWITYDEDGIEIETRGASGNFPYDCSPGVAGKLAAQFINGNVDTQAAQYDGGFVKIYPVGIAKEINVGVPTLT